MTEGQDAHAQAATPVDRGDAAPHAHRPASDTLWEWVDQLERYAEAGLHARGFAHELSNAMTALLGNCELALLGESPEETREDLERIVQLAHRANARLANFKDFLAPAGGGRAYLELGAAVDAAEQFLSHVLRRVAPAGGEPSLVKHLDARGPIAMAPPRLVHALTASLHAALGDTGVLKGPMVLNARREGKSVIVEISTPAGSEPRSGDETWQTESTGFALEVVARNLEAVGGRFAHAEGRPIRLVLPVADAPQKTDHAPPPENPWSFHGRSRR